MIKSKMPALMLMLAAFIPMTGAHAQSLASLPLVQQGNLVYQGAFLPPEGTSDLTTFDYGGEALAYNPANNSLLMTGHTWHQRVAEISIPTPVKASSASGLPRATLLQNFADPTEGKRSQITQSDPNGQFLGGQLVFEGRLYMSAFAYYDASGNQTTSHFARPLNLATTGQVVGPVRVGDNPHFVDGYMGLIPSEWREQFGGPALTGMAGVSIISMQSNGPAASVFDPRHIGVLNPVPATELVGYPLSNPLANPEGQNEYFNSTSNVRGIAFPGGTRSVLFFGRHGTGPYCYGEGAECGDSSDPDKGNHAAPYRYQVWAYDANELLKVKAGSKLRHEVRPYAIWELVVPFGSPARKIGGATYDDAKRLVYFSAMYGDGAGPVVHVFKVDVGTSAALPNPPSSLNVR